MAEHALTPKELTDIIRTFAESDLQELRLSAGDVELLVSRNEVVDVGHDHGGDIGARSRQPAAVAPPVEVAGGSSPPEPEQTAAPAAAERTAAPPATGLIPVLSPAMGVFYRRPSPDEQPYVEVGARVDVGEPVGTMEVMKMFTTVRADMAGTVKEIVVADATLVEYHQVLMYLDPDA